MKDIILKKFGEVYGTTEGARAFFAPGRVNLSENIQTTTEVMYFRAH